jgi:hypothetical protein
VDVQITDSVFETKSSSLAAPSVDPSPTSASFILGILGERLVIGFLGGIFLQKKKKNYSKLQPTMTSVIDANKCRTDKDNAYLFLAKRLTWFYW